jgi:hypothetical protein
MPYLYQLQNQRRLRRAILAAAAIGGLLLVLAVPERMLGWSGLGIGTPAVSDAPVFMEVIADKPVAALRTPPSLGHLAFPAYAEWTESTETLCLECDWNWGYGVDSLVDAVDDEALVELESSSTPAEHAADASPATSNRGFGGGAGAGGVGGSGMSGGGSSSGAAANGEDGRSNQAATAAPAEEAAAPSADEASDAGTTKTAEAVAETGGEPARSWGGSSAPAAEASAGSDPAPLPSLFDNVGSQAPDTTAGPLDEAPIQEALEPLLHAGANLPYSGPNPRNVPPTPSEPVPEPPVTPEPPMAPDDPGGPQAPTEPETPVAPSPPAVPEPASLILMGLALTAVVYRMRR